jgi:alpha-ketoglutaric semialdehyde dehydrogenase
VVNLELIVLTFARGRRTSRTYRLLQSGRQVTAAVEAGLLAFPGWRDLSVLHRGAILQRCANILRQRREAIARTVACENGKTLAEARVEADKSADFFEYYASFARAPVGVVLPDARTATHAMTLQEPLGLVALVTPWNDPMLTPARKLGPALISGNTIVLKPARETPLAADHLISALVEAGLPAGVVNTVLSSHAIFNDEVLERPELKALSFTGSTPVGLDLSRRLAGRNVRLQTEMGGKNASVILADADLELAVRTVVAASFGQAGQRCTATSRVIVESPIAASFLARLKEVLAAIKLGSSEAPCTEVGPVVSRRHQAQVLAHIENARRAGGQIVFGGGVPQAPELAHGCFVEPTVVTGITADMALWRDEVFGPVLAIREVHSFAEAVAAVNDSGYGLSAAIFTRTLQHAHCFIREADVGQVAVNLPTSGWDVHQPFGGFKLSGSAFKEQGPEALRFYTRTKMSAIRFE